VRKADSLTTILCRCLGTITSWKSLGYSGPVTGLIYLFHIEFAIFIPFLVRLEHNVLFCLVVNPSCVDLSLIFVAIFDPGFGFNAIWFVRI